MGFEDRAREIDERVAGALEPDAATVARVVTRSLDAHFSARPVWSRALLGASLAVLALAATVLWLKSPTTSTGGTAIGPTVTITGTGSSIVVRHSDGRRLFIDNTAAPIAEPDSSYAIIVRSGVPQPEGEKR